MQSFMSAAVIVILFLSVMSGSQAQKRTGNKSTTPTKTARANNDWHLSWNRFLEAVQNCLNAERKSRIDCHLSKFKGQPVNWEGIFKGIRQTEKAGEVVDIEMTPGSMTDSHGETAKVASSLAITSSDPEVWRKLAVGQKVRFRAKTSRGILGAGFFPTNEIGCCFIVDFDGKAELVRNSKN